MLEHASKRVINGIQGVVISTMTLLGFWAMRDLPPGTRVPIHFDAQGVANGWADPVWGLLGIPAGAAGLWALQTLLSRMQTPASGQARELQAVNRVLFAGVALLALLQGVVVLAALGLQPPTLRQMLLPLGAFLLVIASAVSRMLDPENPALARSAGAVRTIRLAVFGSLAAVVGVVAADALGEKHLQQSLLLTLPGALFVVLGNVMGKLRPNTSVGIRTSWTLRNERVWDQAHRWGGKAMVLGGALLLALAATPLPPVWQAPAVVVVALTLAGATWLKSYRLWQALPPGQRIPNQN